MASTTTDVIDGVSTSTAIKAPCRLATTANITLSGTQTIDSVVGAVNDRILVKDQTDATENGIYLMQTTAWTRAVDFDGNRDVKSGTLIKIQSGSTQASKLYEVTTDDPIVIGTSSILFSEYGIPNSTEWIATGSTPTYLSATTFQLATGDGNKTADYHIGRRIKLEDSSTLYGVITASNYNSAASNATHITVALDSGSISATLTAVYLGTISAINSAMPLGFYPPESGETGITNYTYPRGHLLRYGAKMDGTTNDTTAVTNWCSSFKTGTEQIFPNGTAMIDGNITISASNISIVGYGTLKKRGVTVQPMLILADEVSNVRFYGMIFDGDKTAYASGNGVPAVFGYINKNIKFYNCIFQNIIDVGIKLRDSYGVYVSGCDFYNIGQSGIEFRTYDTDVRTGIEYTGIRPTQEGGHRIIGNRFEYIDDGNSGAGDGIGVTFDVVTATKEAPRIRDIVISNNIFQDCLRAVWSENNIAGYEAFNVVISNNTIQGNIRGSGTVETKDGIGLIGVKYATISNNTILNCGNFAPVGGNCSGIQISNTTSQFINITDNVIIDNSGNANRMDYGMNINAGDRITARGNYISGASILPINVTSANVTMFRSYENGTANDEDSWASLVPFNFTTTNIAASQTALATYPFGLVNNGVEMILPTAGRLVAVSARLTATISTGGIDIKTYLAGVNESAYDISEVDFSGTQSAIKKLGIDSGVILSAGVPFKVEIDTDGTWSPTTNNIIITLYFDLTQRE